MPKAKCYVPGCQNTYEFRFPKTYRQAWLDAIGRPDDIPKLFNGLCAKHFCPDDFTVETTRSDVEHIRKRLRPNVIPSRNIPKVPLSKRRSVLFKDVQNSCCRTDDNGDDVGASEESMPNSSCDDPIDSSANTVSNESQISETDSTCDPTSYSEFPIECEVVICDATQGDGEKSLNEEDPLKISIIDNGKPTADSVSENRENDVQPMNISVSNIVCKTNKRFPLKSKHKFSLRRERYDILQYVDWPEGVKYYTGLETYPKFMFVFQSLRTDIYSIKYHDTPVKRLSLDNQFFLTLWKLKRNTPDFELGDHFGIAPLIVSNIFVSMISFMAEQWGKMNTWLSRSLTDHYMPESFKKAKASKPQFQQQASWSANKNSNTNQVLATGKPCELISGGTPARGGTTSDCQIVEHRGVADKVKSGDSITASQGFNVQDKCVPKEIAINIPALLKGKEHLPAATLMRDGKLAKEKVRTVRLIGLDKSYSILSKELDAHYAPFASEIFFVCAILCNFTESITVKPK